jgi:hypothetical protein
MKVKKIEYFHTSRTKNYHVTIREFHIDETTKYGAATYNMARHNMTGKLH